MKIAILYICTGKYNIFWKDFYLSCEKYFINNADKEYFVFTDAEKIDFEESGNVHKIYQNDLGWPDNTLMRYEMFLKQKEFILKTDYAFFFNANTLFLKNINQLDFLPNDNERFTAAIHPGFYKYNVEKFPYERNEESLASISFGDGSKYFQGAINGGITSYFVEALETMSSNIKKDKDKNIIAIWHDESHWNKYLSDKPYVKILSPAYIYPENLDLPFEKIILMRDKNKYGGHNNLRGEKVSLKGKIIKLLKKVIKKVIN